MPLIAGHHFTADPLGRLTCVCGRRWADIAGATRADLGAEGWAHLGTLAEFELAQIVAAREAAWLRGLGRVEGAAE